MRRLLLGLPVAFALSACARTPAAAPSLAGEWEPVGAQLGGAEFAVSSFAGAHLRLTDTSYEFAGDRGSYAVVSTDVPAKMDIIGREGPNAGRTIQTIFELTGDRLTVCYQLGSGERPAEFASAPGSQILLVRYKRVTSAG